MKCLLSHLSFPLLLASPLGAGSIEVQIPNVAPGGQVRAALFQGQGAFNKDKRQDGVIGAPVNGQASMVFKGVENGHYGIAVFQDLNGNGTLDKNLLGIPTEPYGFSRNPQIGMRAPTYDKISFQHEGQDQVLVIRLNGL